ncbi:Zn-dependent hydrolase, partial [Flavobacteriaceae bacterium]|nr:Zn-dependent hydrolase [Flavobacteriaceae bacterium]
HLSDYLNGLGLDVSVDAAGNLIARRAGKNPALKPIAFGSHIDAVPNGGHYDGDVGVIGAIEVLETLVENEVWTEHPLELIIFSNEEGAIFGSRAIAGKIDEATLAGKTASGYTNGEGILRLGGNPEKVMGVERSKEDLHAFLELHIEQGNILHKNKLDIGVVEGIVGLKWWDVEITGKTNHAGTTPMNDRQDAMMAAAHFVLAVNDIVTQMEGAQVGTVGRIQAFPGAPNVIPGKVIASLELRDLDAEKIALLFNQISKEAIAIGEATETNFSFIPIDATAAPALTDLRVQEIIRKNAIQLGYTHKTLPSGAGHDAQDMAVITPTGMIFVPSVGGISHAPDEYSSPEAIAKGVNVLLLSILSLDSTDFN